MDSDVLDDAPDIDLVDEAGEKLTDHAAERALVGLLLLHPHVAPGLRDILEPSLFHDRALGRVFEGLVKLEGFAPDNADVIGWLGGDKVEIAGRTGTQLVGYLRSLGVALVPEDAAELSDRIAAVGERRLTGEGQAHLAGFDDFQSKMGLVTWAERNSFAGDQYPFLVEDIIPENELVMIIGATQAGKSFLAFHLAMCIARGVPFFGKRILQAQPVVWCAFEGGRGARARMLGYDHFHGLQGSEFPFAVLTNPIDLWTDEKNVDLLINEITGVCRSEFAGQKPGAIVIDTYNAATPGASEIDSEVVSKIRGRLRRLARVLGCAIIIVGHTNAAGKARGNEQLPNNADTVIRVAKKMKHDQRQPEQIKDNDGRDVRTVDLEKQREGATGHLFDFVLPAVDTGLIDGFGKPRTTCVVTAPNWTPAEKEASSATKNRTAKQLGPIQTGYFKALWEALLEYGEPAPAHMKLPKSTRVVKTVHVMKVWNQRQPPDISANTSKSRRQRAETYFQNKGVIRIDNDAGITWWTGRYVADLEETHSRQRTMFDEVSERRMPLDDEFPE